jgi:3-hydroxyisobutyrate dehydrogenase
MGERGTARSAAILGTGIMGAAMARNVAGAGIETAAWNRHPERALPLEAAGVELFEAAHDAVRGRDVVLTMLPDVEVVASVMSSEVLAAMPAGAVWVQSSTVGVEGARELIALAADAGVSLLDAPVSGTRAPAEAGQLVILASGEADAASFCRPVLDAIGARTVWLGEAGNGSRMKLVTNDWVLGLTALMAEAMQLCEGLGLARESFLEALEGAPVDSPYAQAKGGMMISGEFEPHFPLEHGAKDTRLIMQAAAHAGLDLPLAASTAAHFATALAAGAGSEDVAAVYRAMAR